MGDIKAADSGILAPETMMSDNHALLWPPQASDGKVRFDVWESLFDMYISDSDITDPKKEVKVLLQTIGTNMLEKIIDWSPKKPQGMEYDDLIKLIKGKFMRKPNLAALRVKFFIEKQQPGQGFDEYFSHMAQLFGQCQLDKMTADDVGVVAVLKGLAQDDTRQFFMTSSTEMKSISKVQELASMFEQGKAAARDEGGNASRQSYSINFVGKARECGYCGDEHQSGKERCPAKGKKCKNCGKINHFARVCRSAKKQNVVERAESINGIYGVLTVSSMFQEDNHPFFLHPTQRNRYRRIWK
uniref:CCHC-type domain-containing protein n=1 Tax=Panagrolaimus sp. ES5 TaxID=591445 RepID=A0AC34FT30_9BILA